MLCFLRALYDRYKAIGGRATAASITLYGFLALFAIAVLAIAVVGFVSSTDRDVATRIVNWLGVRGTAARTVTDAVDKARESRRLATAVAIAGLIWVGSSFAVAVANAYNVAWRVPARIARERLVGLLWLLGAGVLLAAGGFVTGAFTTLPVLVVPLVLLAALVVNTTLWVWTSWILPNRRLVWRNALPAAVVGAVGLEALKLVGGFVVPRLVAGSSALYGTLGAVFALISWLWLFGRLAVFVTVVEVLTWERTHGTDDVEGVVPAGVVPR
jgi:membrane protein